MLEWMFRPQCAACSAASAPLCSTCVASLDPLGPACPRCAEPTGERAIVCARCVRRPLPLDRIVVPWQFGGELASAIRRLKFSGATHVARTLAPLWAPVLAAAAAELGDRFCPFVVPVPLHWRRRCIRGYDHAYLLALHACASARLAPPHALLRRIRHAPPQSSLPAADRWANVRGSFVARRAIDRPVILVDDVVTTGATIAAAAAALREAGAPAILGVALARAV